MRRCPIRDVWCQRGECADSCYQQRDPVPILDLVAAELARLDELDRVRRSIAALRAREAELTGKPFSDD